MLLYIIIGIILFGMIVWAGKNHSSKSINKNVKKNIRRYACRLCYAVIMTCGYMILYMLYYITTIQKESYSLWNIIICVMEIGIAKMSYVLVKKIWRKQATMMSDRDVRQCQLLGVWGIIVFEINLWTQGIIKNYNFLTMEPVLLLWGKALFSLSEFFVDPKNE